MKKQIDSEELVDILKKRQETVDAGFPHFDEIEKIVSEVIIKNIKKIASDNDVWKFIRPHVDKEEYNATNEKLSKEYQSLQRLEYKMNRLKDKVSKIIEKEEIKLGEFEEIGSIYLEDGKAYMNILDKVEEYKKMLREKNEQK